jgi:hypothetical protein
MKNGYRLVYHKSLKGSEKQKAETTLGEFVLGLAGSHNYAKQFNTKGGYASSLRWKALGKSLGSCCSGDNLVLRRLSKNRRIFGVVPRDLVFSIPGACSTQYEGCMCPKCTWEWTGGKGFKMDGPYKDEDYILFYESGKIKG